MVHKNGNEKYAAADDDDAAEEDDDAKNDDDAAESGNNITIMSIRRARIIMMARAMMGMIAKVPRPNGRRHLQYVFSRPQQKRRHSSAQIPLTYICTKSI